VKAVLFPDGATVRDLRQGAPGCDGDVRVQWKGGGAADWQSSDWQPVDGLRDFTRQFTLEGLEAGTRYQVRVESRSVDRSPGAAQEGEFRTAPSADVEEPIVFVVATCFGNDDQDSPEGFKIHRAMRRLNPRFFVHTGDIIYYDELAKTAELARWHWQRMYSWPSAVDFHRQVASYFMKDDHDTWRNDCWPTMVSPYMHEFTFRQGQAIFREQVPMRESTYRTFRWGKDLQIWMVEGRDFRDPNDMPDGPGKTVWGKEQKAWFRRTVGESDATFRVLISPTPLVGPDREKKHDNHSNAGFQHEGSELRQFAAMQKNMVVLCGDRHWQYMSVDPPTGLREFSVGPASTEHAGGWEPDDFRADYHRYMKVIGGFLSVTIDREGGKPTMTMRHHGVDGKVLFENVMATPRAAGD
jgi:alkaline phosphatase D